MPEQGKIYAAVFSSGAHTHNLKLNLDGGYRPVHCTSLTTGQEGKGNIEELKEEDG